MITVLTKKKTQCVFLFFHEKLETLNTLLVTRLNIKYYIIIDINSTVTLSNIQMHHSNFFFKGVQTN